MLIREARREAGLPAWSEGGVGATVIDEATGEVLPNPEWVRPPRPARCGWRVDADVSVWHDDEKGAHWQGIERCGSIWACPCCAAVVRAEYAQDIQTGVENWLAQGGGLMFVTFTIRHRMGQPLQDGLNAVVGGFRRVQQGQTWANFKVDHGIVGSVRSVEVTYGENGWHPHLHALFFLDKPVDAKEEVIWKTKLTDRWQRAVQELGALMPSEFRAVDVRAADSEGTVVGQYLAKVQEKEESKRYGIGMELARGDMKQGRVGSITPMELLDLDYLEDEGEGDGLVSKRWTEYVRATKGRHAVRWTKGMRARLGLESDQQRTPEEVLADRERAENLALVIPGEEYDEVRNNGVRLCLILEEVEDGNLAAAAELVQGVSARLPEITTVPSDWLAESTYEASEYVADQQPVGGEPVRRPRAVWVTDLSPERIRGLYPVPSHDDTP